MLYKKVYLTKEKNNFFLTSIDINHDIKNDVFKLIANEFLKNYLEQIESSKYLIKECNSKILNKMINILKEYNYDIEYDTNTHDLLNFSLKNYLTIGKNIKDKNLDKEYEEYRTFINSNLNRELKDHQLINSFFHYKMIASANFSVPGSGKTSTIYASFLYLKEKKKIDKLLIVAPKSAYFAWKEEFIILFNKEPKIFTNNKLNESLFLDLFQSDKINEIIRENYDLLFFNYESIRERDKQEKLLKIIDEKTLIIVDESHRMKNQDSKTFESMFNISQNAKYKIILSGTPIPNGYKDIYTSLKFMHNFYYEEFWKLEKSNFNNLDKFQIKELKEKLFSFFVRTNKKDLKIPEAFEDNVIEYFLNEDEKFIYENLWITIRNPLVLYIRLLQSLIDPSLLLKTINEEIDFKNEENKEEIIINEDDFLNELEINENNFLNGKMKEIIEKQSLKVSSKLQKSINTIVNLIKEDKNVLVWSTFISPMYKLKEELEKLNINNIFIINGSTKYEERDEMIKKFHNLKKCILISNPQTLAESISLHKTCHDAIYLDYSYNLVHLLQSKDRIHRLGISENERPNYYFFENQSTEFNIEKKIFEVLKEKEKIMINTIESEMLNEFNNDFSSKQFIENIIERIRK